MKLAHRFDSLLARNATPDSRRWPATTQLLDTMSGRIRVLDTGSSQAALLMAPDGPCVIEHYADLIDRLRTHFRVICFDLPGFGFSFPTAGYRHELRQGADVILAVLNALNIPRATLAFSCVNGFYAMAAAKLAPERVERLMLTQTPDIHSMHDWASRIVPLPIRIPLIGQTLNRITRRKAAKGWFSVALADRALRPQFQNIGDDALCHGACWSLAGVVQGMQSVSDSDPLLEDIRVPTTLLWGTRDRSHKPTDPQSLRRHIREAHIEQVEVGHFADLEATEVYSRLLMGQH